jgi:Mat/Ecp fimbriae major subunit
MKNLAIGITLAVSVLLVSAGTANAASGGATVQIVNAIALSNTVGLNFGQVIGGSGASVVTVTPGGVRTLTSGTAILAGGTVTAASFAVTGGIGAAYTVTLPATVDLTSDANTLTITSVTSSPTGAAGLLDSSGNQTLLVGGVLAIPAGPAASGIYSGTFDVTVAYN